MGLFNLPNLKLSRGVAAMLNTWMWVACCRLCAVLLVSVMASSPGNAQAVIYPEEPDWLSAPSNRTLAVAIGDVDGDGDLDLVCGNYSGKNALYLNEGGIFSTIPAWLSGVENYTASVALGDIDGDGDLDLVCGNGGSNTLHLNSGGMFSELPDWSSGLANSTEDIALADIDGNGDLDLICSNNDERNTLYLNDGSMFFEFPAWYSSSATATHKIAVGDVDNDGDLDLVCGELYLNEGGTFTASPAWSSGTVSSVALGDMDGDGYLDLACGNGFILQLYLNIGGVFSDTPVWGVDNFMVNGSTTDLALGDVDRDGDLDLVCATEYPEVGGRSNLLYLNVGDAVILSREGPNWLSGPMYKSFGVALGDIDGNGYPDLIFGNAYSNTLYLSTGGVFSNTPDWEFGPGFNTHCVQLGDVDGDGDLDLVRGNYGSYPSLEPNTLHRNDGGIVSEYPVWSSSLTNHTRCVALGDINGDGNLDLVCGNEGEGNTLYVNEGGVFSASPVWISEQANKTISVALDDVDGDGDLDLICGNADFGNPYEDERHTLYLNDGGELSTSPDWVSGQSGNTSSVVLGDVDHDGDPDLVCGDSEYGMSIYYNNAGLFSSTPDWSSGPGNIIGNPILGDVNGDAFIDLVCNTGMLKTLYLNVGGEFSTIPAWSAGELYFATACMDLGDLDGDGALDLVCGNKFLGDEPETAPNTVYKNVNGVFSSAPIWTAEYDSWTNSADLGDVDNDGDLDVVFGNAGILGEYGAASYLHNGKMYPAFIGNPVDPAHHLPNNNAFLRNVAIHKAGVNVYQVAFDVIDIESDPVWIIPEYQFAGTPEWYPFDMVGYTGKLGPLTSSPEGAEHQFDWDVSVLPFDSRDIIIRLRSISSPRRVALIHYVASYFKIVGPIEPSRPEITTSDNAVSFPTITVGDTISLDMTISNTGNELLSVTDIILPSNEMGKNLEPPLHIDPGNDAALTMSLRPRADTEIAGNLLIESNDPISPTTTVWIDTDIRALHVESNLLTPNPVLPLGEAVTVVVSPFPDVRVERGYLYHRLGGSETFQDSIPLSKYGDDFIAVIPGTAVTEAGLEYFVKVENSGIFATDPNGAPDSFFTQAVEAPAAISSFPQPNSGPGFLENRPIRIEVILPDGAVFNSGILHYRRGGEWDYQTLAIEYEDPSPVATIADTIAGPRGLEYWVEVNTLTSILTDPPITPTHDPRTIQVTVQNLEEETLAPESRYRMISIPLVFGEDFSSTIEALLAEQPEFGPYDPVNWRSYRYIPDLGRYAELSDADASEHFCPEPGRAFWLVSREVNRITTAPISGYSTPTDSAYEVQLEPGWNMIGNPFNFPVSWDSILVGELTMAEADTIVEPPIRWIIDRGYQYGVRILEPFVGYWVKNLSGSNIVLKFPPKEAPSESPLREPEVCADQTSADEEARSWNIVLKSSSNEASDASNIIGTRQDARNSWDKYDGSEPPMSPGPSISLYFPHTGWKEQPGRYSTDIRGGYQAIQSEHLDIIRSEKDIWGHIWRFDVAKNYSAESAGDQILLGFEILENVPAEAKIFLIDRNLARVVDIREEDTYIFYLGKRDFVIAEEEARFMLLVGSEDFISTQEDEMPKLPTHTALHQNYPNPFNPSTIIRYEIAEASQVTISVYDVKGSLVKLLYRGYRKPGSYEVGWNGRNSEGGSVTSGIYFCRLTAGDFIQTKKMVLLR